MKFPRFGREPNSIDKDEYNDDERIVWPEREEVLNIYYSLVLGQEVTLFNNNPHVYKQGGLKGKLVGITKPKGGRIILERYGSDNNVIESEEEKLYLILEIEGKERYFMLDEIKKFN